MFNKTLDTARNPILSGELLCAAVRVRFVRLCVDVSAARREFALRVAKRAALLRGQCVNQVLRGEPAPL